MRYNDIPRTTFLLIQLLVCATGCGSSTTSNVSATDNEHLEHHRPEHRPASFTAAIEQIASRHNRIRAEMHMAVRGSLDREFSELLDIFSWLPEIAGDSDLRQADWESVQRNAETLASLLGKLDPTDTSVQLDSVSLNKMETLIEELRKLVPASVGKY